MERPASQSIVPLVFLLNALSTFWGITPLPSGTQSLLVHPHFRLEPSYTLLFPTPNNPTNWWIWSKPSAATQERRGNSLTGFPWNRQTCSYLNRPWTLLRFAQQSSDWNLGSRASPILYRKRLPTYPPPSLTGFGG